jgi:hypothetical protein
MVHRKSLAAAAAAVVLAFHPACGGGGSSPTTPPTVPSTTAPPVTTPPTTTPPVGGAGECPLGKGTADTSCRTTSPTFVDQVDAAIDELVRQQPQIFDLNDQRGPGAYMVRDVNAYYAGVVKNLQTTGVCAGFDFEFLNVKNTNEFSDRYDIITSTGHARRGTGTYQGSCFPANFPVDAREVIAYIRVAFYGFGCPAGITPPHPANGKLPIGCEGYLTATPKDRNGEDVDSRIHGDNIVWKLEDGKGVVDTHHHDGQPFNWTIEPRLLGTFRFCATLQGIQGCLNGEVIPNP